jgi:hypothetical protein
MEAGLSYPFIGLILLLESHCRLSFLNLIYLPSSIVFRVFSFSVEVVSLTMQAGLVGEKQSMFRAYMIYDQRLMVLCSKGYPIQSSFHSLITVQCVLMPLQSR